MIRALGAAGTLLFLGSCGIPEARRESGYPAAPPQEQAGHAAQDDVVKIGNPYQVNGVTYTPADVARYDEVGYASWYAEESGSTTANGEVFVTTAITAAHRTLPLPSYVEVTSLDTGRTILVRVNDRGPFANDRILDLSRGAAEQLGITGNGWAAVRVRRVSPPEQERAILRGGGKAAERLETPKSLLAVLRAKLPPRPSGRATPVPSHPATRPAPGPITAPTPKVPTPPTPVTDPSDPFIVEQEGRQSAPPPQSHSAPRPVSGGYSVQIAALSSQQRAVELGRKIGASVILIDGLWRVRFGPYASRAAAEDGLHRAEAAGFNDARIVVND